MRPIEAQKYIENNWDGRFFALAFNSTSGWKYYDVDGKELPSEGFESRLASVGEVQESAKGFNNFRDLFIAFRSSEGWVLAPIVKLPDHKPTEVDKVEFKPYSPFTDAEPPNPEFPVYAFPEVFKRYIEASAKSFQVSPAMPGVEVLAVLSTIFQHGGHMVKVNDDWTEPVGSLYIMCSAQPSELKSPSLKDAKTPMVETVREWNEANRGTIEWSSEQINIKKEHISNLRKKLGR